MDGIMLQAVLSGRSGYAWIMLQAILSSGNGYEWNIAATSQYGHSSDMSNDQYYCNSFPHRARQYVHDSKPLLVSSCGCHKQY